MGELTKIATVDQVSLGAAICVEVKGKQIALFNVDGSYYATDNNCSHRGGPLSEGVCEGTVVTCPWHGIQFNLETGEPLGSLAVHGITAYSVTVEGDDLKIKIS
ncbi:MAG: non-heme iron oxygenase ferredoxin subunit [Acidobacteriota bacterium]|nr:non-heme iron oxygenase ferredoxin subunit [Acidobacteriota bacterium]